MAKRSLRPGDLITVALGDDESAVRPVLQCRVPNVHDSRRMIELATSDGTTAQLDGLIEVAQLFVRGWDNMPDPETGDALPFSKENIVKALSFQELAELAGIAMETFVPSSADKKK